ncbi:hypothetical protein L9F63_024956, partial [Diploptera punctata]
TDINDRYVLMKGPNLSVSTLEDPKCSFGLLNELPQLVAFETREVPSLNSDFNKRESFILPFSP